MTSTYRVSRENKELARADSAMMRWAEYWFFNNGHSSTNMLIKMLEERGTNIGGHLPTGTDKPLIVTQCDSVLNQMIGEGSKRVKTNAVIVQAHALAEIEKESLSEFVGSEEFKNNVISISNALNVKVLAKMSRQRVAEARQCFAGRLSAFQYAKSANDS